jgi:hypothetical protein
VYLLLTDVQKVALKTVKLSVKSVLVNLLDGNYADITVRLHFSCTYPNWNSSFLLNRKLLV